MSGAQTDEVYFEFTAIGGYARVSAVCATTGTEVVIMGPINAARHDLERLALRKLERKLAQERGN